MHIRALSAFRAKIPGTSRSLKRHFTQHSKARPHISGRRRALTGADRMPNVRCESAGTLHAAAMPRRESGQSRPAPAQVEADRALKPPRVLHRTTSVRCCPPPPRVLVTGSNRIPPHQPPTMPTPLALCPHLSTNLDPPSSSPKRRPCGWLRHVARAHLATWA